MNKILMSFDMDDLHDESYKQLRDDDPITFNTEYYYECDAYNNSYAHTCYETHFLDDCGYSFEHHDLLKGKVIFDKSTKKTYDNFAEWVDSLSIQNEFSVDIRLTDDGLQVWGVIYNGSFKTHWNEYEILDATYKYIYSDLENNIIEKWEHNSDIDYIYSEYCDELTTEYLDEHFMNMDDYVYFDPRYFDMFIIDASRKMIIPIMCKVMLDTGETF